MLYRETAPGADLQPYINCFWMIQSPELVTIRDRTFPDGCQEIVFSIGTRVLRDDGAGYTTNPAVELIGQMTRPYDLVTRGQQTFFGIKFFPHSFSLFTGESIHDLRDQSIDSRELLGPEFQRVVDAVLERPEFPRFVEVMETFFRHRLGSAASDRAYQWVDQAVQRLFSQSEPASIDTLSTQLGVSDRYLQRLFRHRVGLTPRQLLKMIRFQRSFQYLDQQRLSLTDIAQRCGYYDHAHFAHDFKAFAGISPSGYRTLGTPLNRFFLASNSRAYLCNYRGDNT